MIIVAGGDSFVWGSELKDASHTTYSKNTFTALVSKDYEYACVAFPGYSNDAIARSIIDYCEQNKNKPLFVIASWTFPGRYEFKLNSSWTTITSWTVGKQFEDDDSKHLNTLVDKFKHDAKQTGIYDFATAFFKHVGFTEYWEIYSTLKEIVYLQNYLKVNNVPYMFTTATADFLSSYTITNPDTSITSLHNQINFDNWFFFPYHKGFHTWALDNKYEIGDTHPLELAHSDAAELIRSKFNELVTQYNQQNQIRN